MSTMTRYILFFLASFTLQPTLFSGLPIVDRLMWNDIITYILRGYDISMQDAYGATLLHYAVVDGPYEAIALLLRRDDIDVNAQTNHGTTALHFAVITNKADREMRVKLLLNDKRVDPTILTNDLVSPLDLVGHIHDASLQERLYTLFSEELESS